MRIYIEKERKNNMEEYIKEIEQIAARCTESQSDGYSQIMRICDVMREEFKGHMCMNYVCTQTRKWWQPWGKKVG